MNSGVGNNINVAFPDTEFTKLTPVIAVGLTLAFRTFASLCSHLWDKIWGSSALEEQSEDDDDETSFKIQEFRGTEGEEVELFINIVRYSFMKTERYFLSKVEAKEARTALLISNISGDAKIYIRDLPKTSVVCQLSCFIVTTDSVPGNYEWVTWYLRNIRFSEACDTTVD
ncbi:MAG: hypothetical protein Q9168_001689 [Polycauliona sp. 1 TL-2023]